MIDIEPMPRPPASRPVSERARQWLAWFGPARLIAASVATVIVCAGGFWLLRAPAPPTEATLPRASTTPGADATFAAPTVSAAATTTTTIAVPALVHVAGAVDAPGVYRLDFGARVIDAVAAAGGPSAEADTDALNLAAPVADGMRIYVPRIGEEPTGALLSGGAPAGDGTTRGVPSGPVDVNRATASELEALPGIGPATAAAIVAERERNGPFLGVDDLERVPGIGPAKLAALRDLVTT